MTRSRATVGPRCRDSAGRLAPHLGLAGATLLLMLTPAAAAHCPRGQIWMIHERVCVGRHLRHVHMAHLARPVPEVPSHKGITYVHVVEPPEPPKPPPPRPVDIPYELPGSIMSHAYKPTWRVQ